MTRRRRIVAWLIAAMLVLPVLELALRAVESAAGARSGTLYDYIVPSGRRFKLRASSTVRVPERYGDVVYRINSLGYRDDDPRRTAATRIVVLGDSVTFGLGVAQDAIWPQLLEDSLRSAPGSAVEVANLAIFAYDCFDELAALREDGLALQPTAVLLQLYLNDLAGQGHPPSARLTSLRDRWTATKNLWMWRSALCRRANQATGMLAYAVLHDVRRSLLSGSLNDAEPAGASAFLRAHPDDSSVPAFRATREIHDTARAAGARLAVLISPDETQLYDDAYHEVNRRIMDFCSREAIPCLDLLPALRARSDRARLFYDGVHYSPAGHQAVALLAQEFLTRSGLAP